MIAISWFYGVNRLCKNIKQMTGKTPSLYFRSCWLVVGPLLLFVSITHRYTFMTKTKCFFFLKSLWIFSLINYEQPTYHNGKYEYPRWAHGIGWTIASASLICIPAYAFINIIRAEGDTFLEV